MEVAKFQFALKTQNSFGLSGFNGSTSRGEFGDVLKRTTCVVLHKKCEICEIRLKCAYVYLYETKNERNGNVARSFVLENTHPILFLFPADGQRSVLEIGWYRVVE